MAGDVESWLGGWTGSLASDVISQTVGSSASLPGNSSGSKDNTNCWTIGEVGRFLLRDANGNRYGLKVEALNPTGALSAGTDSLMVARTVDSQGLKDDGTVSLDVNPDRVGTNWSLGVRFSFASADDFSTTLPMNSSQLASLDIDASRRFYVKNEDFYSSTPYPQTALSSVPTVVGYTGYTSASGSNFNDPKHAVSSHWVSGLSESDVRLVHDGVAMFMFEFRNSSSIVPKPGSVLLSLVAGVGVLARRRR